MTTPQGSRHAVRCAVVRLAHAEGRLPTMEALDELAREAHAWRRVLSVDPKTSDMVEHMRDRYLKQAA